MLFSIIVPVYKVEKYLEACVDSILTQSFNDFELILVDDGSPDNCPSICDRYAEKDSRVKVIHKPNGGQSSARNVGLIHASGDYLVYLDSDDFFISSESLKYIADATGSDTDIIMYKTATSGESGENISYPFMDMNFGDDKTAIAQMLSKAVCGEAFQTSAWSKAIKRNFLLESGTVFKEKMSGEDIDWYIDIVRKATSFTAIDEYVYVYRRRPGSVTKTSDVKNLADLIWILNKWDKTLGESDTDKALRHYLGKTYSGLLIMYSGIKNSKKKEHKTEVKSMSHLLKYDMYPRTKKIKIAYSVLGFDITVFLLKIARYIKSKL